MRLCLVGDEKNPPEIGERVVFQAVIRSLAESHEVHTLTGRDLFSANKLRELRRFRPTVIHSWAGPRWRTFVVLKLIKMITAAKVSVQTATRPQFSRLGLAVAKAFAPDLLLAQSPIWNRRFERAGFRVLTLGQGVDKTKFFVASEPRKLELRRQYALPPSQFVVLHVGHVTQQRGLNMLCRIAALPNYRVLVIGAVSAMRPASEVVAALQASGCDVRLEFIPNIADLFQASDCYVFPGGLAEESHLPLIFARKGDVPAIDTPLTPLEARACGVPVVTSKFGGLVRLLKDDQGTWFCDDETELMAAVELVRQKHQGRAIEPTAELLSWEQIGRQLSTLYDRLAAS